MEHQIDELLEELQQVLASDLSSSKKASTVYSIKCRLRKLGWSPDSTNSDEHWHCPKCDNSVVAHVPMLEVACNRHTGGRIRMIRK